MLSDSQFFTISFDLSPPYNAYFIKLTFGSSTTDWTNKLLCSTGTCPYVNYKAGSVLSNDGSKIYSFFPFGTTNYLYLAIFNASSGAVSNSRFKSSISCSAVYGIAQKGSYILISVLCSSYDLILFNSDLFTFNIKKSSGGYSLDSCLLDPQSGRFIVVGTRSNSIYTTMFMLESLNAHSDFLSDTWTMNSLSSGTDDIVLISSLSITNKATRSVTSSAYTNQTVNYVAGISSQSNVNYQTNDQYFSVVETHTLLTTPDLPCTSSGSNSIVFSFGSYNGETIPAWVTINSNTGLLTCITPEVTTDSNFNFYINSVISGVSSVIQKHIRITILNCSVNNCQKCIESSSSNCDTCNSGFILSSGLCNNPPQPQNTSSNKVSSDNSTLSESTKASKFSAQLMIGAISGTAIILSMIRISSMSSMWSMINQIQLYFLLLLTRAYIPNNVVETITGCRFALYFPSYISFNKISTYNSIMNNFNYDLSNPMFEYVGLESDSSVYNTNSFFSLILCIILLHLCILILSKILSKCNNCRKCLKLYKIVKWLVNKVYRFLTFGYYIRFILEMTQFLLISCSYEIYMLNTSEVPRIVSLIFCFIILLAIVMIMILIVCLSNLNGKSKDNDHSMFGEFFEGVKTQRRYKLYVLFLVLRRIVFVMALIMMISVSSRILIGILILIQLGYAAYICILRPFTTPKDNATEVINEILFTILFSSLIGLNTQENWNNTLSIIYMWTIASNSIVVMLIVSACGIRAIIGRCTIMLKRSKTNNLTSVIPLQSLKPANVNHEEVKFEENLKNPSLVSIHEESKIEFYRKKSSIKIN